MWETRVQPLGWEEIPWRRKWQPTPVFLPGESRGQRSLVGCSSWGRKESDMTEWLHSLTKVGKASLILPWSGYFYKFKQKRKIINALKKLQKWQPHYQITEFGIFHVIIFSEVEKICSWMGIKIYINIVFMGSVRDAWFEKHPVTHHLLTFQKLESLHPPVLKDKSFKLWNVNNKNKLMPRLGSN